MTVSERERGFQIPREKLQNIGKSARKGKMREQKPKTFCFGQNSKTAHRYNARPQHSQLAIMGNNGSNSNSVGDASQFINSEISCHQVRS
jgi:hypothetical protein